jgi:hypothetical protein
MPVSGLVITMEPSAVSNAVAALPADPRLSVGAPAGAHVPAVLETSSLEESARFVDDLFRTPGVRFVDVVTVDFDDVIEESSR